MALPNCLHFADVHYPRVKAEVARQLTARGWSQSRTAEALNVSQAMISKYASRGKDGDALVQRFSHELLAQLDGIGTDWCRLVESLQEGDQGAMQDFLEAEQMLLAHSPDVMPKIGVNLARLVGGEVLAYPGRMISANGKWVRPVPPELGSTGHLASCLRVLHQANPRIRAIANIRGDQTMRNRVKNCIDLADGQTFAEAAGAGIDTIHDPGDFGIEPCLYIAGETTKAVATRIIELEKS